MFQSISFFFFQNTKGPIGYNLFLLKLKTENWKHYSKIVFKCVNSTVQPIFNEKIVEKWGLWVPWTVHETHWCAYFAVWTVIGWKVKNNDAKKKKKNKQTNVDANATKIIRIQTAPNFNIHRERGESLKKTDNDVYPKIEGVFDKNLRGCVSFFNFS